MTTALRLKNILSILTVCLGVLSGAYLEGLVRRATCIHNTSSLVATIFVRYAG